MARSYAFGVTLISSRSWPNWASANSLDSSCLLRASSSADLSRERSQVLDRGCANFRELRQAEVQLLRIPLPRTPVNKGMKEGRSASPRPRCSPRRPPRRSDTEELLLLGFEIFVGDDALISELGEPLQLAHVLGFVRSRGGSSGLSFGWFLAATKVFVRPKPALDERATPLHARHGPVGLPRPPPLCASFRHKSHLRSPSSLLVRLP